MKDVIEFRSASEADQNFIYCTWLKGLRSGNEWFNRIPRNIYSHHYPKVIQVILNRPNIQTKVCCLKEDSDIILGYSVFEENKNESWLHWIFVRTDWRRLGIAKNLLPKNVTQVSHLTREGIAYKPKGWKFNPFLT